MITLYSNLPSIDLHGMDREYARILINDFIYDNYQIKNEKVIIIHGNGTGVLKKTTQEVLKKSPYVINYRIDNFNSGMTVVSLRKSLDK